LLSVFPFFRIAKIVLLGNNQKEFSDVFLLDNCTEKPEH